MRHALLLAPLAFLAACAPVIPGGPSIVALPQGGTDFGLFQQQDFSCRQQASASIGFNQPGIAGAQAGAASAALSTAAGAGIGALLGAASGNAGAGAAIGAGVGALTGTSIANQQAQATSWGLQQAYDTTYAQCMAAAGHLIQSPPQVVVAQSPFYAPPPVVFGPSVGFYVGPRWGWGRPYYGPRYRRW